MKDLNFKLITTIIFTQGMLYAAFRLK